MGAALAIAGTSVLITLAAVKGDVYQVVSTSIYGGTLIFLYAVSTLYHSFQGRKKQVMQKLDHIAIYLLIAGSYTPFTLVTLHGAWGWWLFGISWGLALVGILFELTLSHLSRIPSLVIYLIMGWLVVVAIRPLLETLPFSGFLWLVTGGVLYTGGVVFYLFDEKVKHFHGIWHLFVLAGSVAQYFCIVLYII